MSYVQEFPGDPESVRAMLRDPEYIQRKAERTGSFDIVVDVQDAADGGLVITCTRSMPAEVPSYAKAFVSDTLTVTEVQTWGPPAADGSATAEVTVSFNAPLAYRGQIALAPGGSGSVATNTGDFKANVPFVGGKVETVASEMTQKYLAKEATVAAEWLAG
jgi:hypothetical protein